MNTNDFNTFDVNNLVCLDDALTHYVYKVGGYDLVHLYIEGFDLDTFDSEASEMTAHLRGMFEAHIKFRYDTFEEKVAPILCDMARGNAVAKGLCCE